MSDFTSDPDVVLARLTLLENLADQLDTSWSTLIDVRDQQNGAWSSFPPAMTYAAQLVGSTENLMQRLSAAREQVRGLGEALRASVDSLDHVDEDVATRMDALTARLSAEPERVPLLSETMRTITASLASITSFGTSSTLPAP